MQLPIFFSHPAGENGAKCRAAADNVRVMPIGWRLARNRWPREGTAHHTWWQSAHAGWGVKVTHLLLPVFG
jgi:hypothetical protein